MENKSNRFFIKATELSDKALSCNKATPEFDRTETLQQSARLHNTAKILRIAEQFFSGNKEVTEFVNCFLSIIYPKGV